MKSVACFLLGILWLTPWAGAQSDPATPPPDMPQPGGHGRRAIDFWMDHLKNSQPEEYQRLQELRAKDPEAFKEQLKKRLRHKRQMVQFKDMPRLRCVLTNLPPEERSLLMEEICRNGPGGEPRCPGGQSQPAGQALEQAAVELAETYRASDDPAERERIKQNIRSNLEQSFDLRQEQRKAMMETMQRKLSELERQLSTRQARRDEIIDRRTQELIDGELPEW